MGFLPQASLTAARTARRTASAHTFGILAALFGDASAACLRPRRARCRACRSPSASAAGTPSMTACGSHQTAPLRDIARLTTTTPTTTACGARAPGPRRRNEQPAVAEQAADRRVVDDAAGPGARRTISPLVSVNDRAERPSRGRARHAPSGGASRRASARRSAASSSAYIWRSSSRRGWPVTCTSASSSVRTSQPMRASPFWMRPTAFSLPGMVREEKMTRSPLASEMLGMLVRRRCGPGRRAARPGCRCTAARSRCGRDR